MAAKVTAAPSHGKGVGTFWSETRIECSTPLRKPRRRSGRAGGSLKTTSGLPGLRPGVSARPALPRVWRSEICEQGGGDSERLGGPPQGWEGDSNLSLRRGIYGINSRAPRNCCAIIQAGSGPISRNSRSICSSSFIPETGTSCAIVVASRPSIIGRIGRWRIRRR